MAVLRGGLLNQNQVEAGRVMLDVAPRVLRAETNVLAALDMPLTHRQYRILYRIGTGMTSLTAISRAASISVAAISESAEGLLNRGLLDREIDERDRRASRLSLTLEGRKAVDTAEQALDELAHGIAANLTKTQLSALKDALALVNSNVKTYLLEGLAD